MANIMSLWSVVAVCLYFVTFIFIITDLEELVFSNGYFTFTFFIISSGATLGFIHY